MRILIADDDPSSRFLLEDLLAEWGHDVVAVSNGAEALDVMKQPTPPRLAVLDWMMPELDGIELCRLLKSESFKKFSYLILLTSKSEKGDLVVGLNAGADDFLSKPVNAEELRSRIAVGERIISYEQELLEKEKSVRLEVYRAITDLAEARDNETGAHLKRLSTYSGLLGEHLELPEAFVDDLRTFAPLHDIGKVGISDNILLAPRKLTREEFETMKTHTTLGYQILHGRPTLEMAAEIAHYHHEKFNGKGYPEGLSGEAIPLSARILALADVYDALCSRRPYKEPWPHKEAADLIHSERGNHFDPAIVDAFLALENRFVEVATAFQDEDL